NVCMMDDARGAFKANTPVVLARRTDPLLRAANPATVPVPAALAPHTTSVLPDGSPMWTKVFTLRVQPPPFLSSISDGETEQEVRQLAQELGIGLESRVLNTQVDFESAWSEVSRQTRPDAVTLLILAGH